MSQAFQRERKLLIPQAVIDQGVKWLASIIAAKYFLFLEERKKQQKQIRPPDSESTLAPELKQAEDPYADAIVLLSVLKGAVPFGVDLQRALSNLGIPLKPYYVSASSYGNETQSSGKVNIDWIRLTHEIIENKFVILLDDIFDTGRTLRELINAIENMNPSVLHTAVLLEKIGVSERIESLLVVFQILNLWVDGYGIDTAEMYRDAKGVWVHINDERDAQLFEKCQELLNEQYKEKGISTNRLVQVFQKIRRIF